MSAAEGSGLVPVEHPAARTQRARRRAERAAAGLARATRLTTRWLRENSASVCLGLTLSGIALYTLVFSILSIRNYQNYGNWSYDMAIYDQAFWLVSRFGDTFMTVRGLDVWGHHVTLVAFLFAPFYRLGAGPEFLFIVQSFGLAVGALPVYLIAAKRFRRPSMGLLFAVAYLLYAPLQNINWRDFHPEALVVAPFLFAWYCALNRRWWWTLICCVIAMAMREDAALAVVMLGVVLLVLSRNSEHRRRDATMAGLTVGLGLLWYVVCTQVIIPHFNAGGSAFYFKFFYSRWGGSMSGIAETAFRHPNRVLADATKIDRLRFYRDLLLPYAGLGAASPLHLLMAAPQLLASVIGDSPYARTILYQYTSVIVAPVTIASIEGARNLWRFGHRWRVVIVVGLVVASYTTNAAWSSSPWSDRYPTIWARNNPRAAALDEAVALVPEGATVSASYNLGPHLARRRGLYDWPNPFVPSYWGNELSPAQQDCDVFPSASVVDYLALDVSLFAGDARTMALIDALTGPVGDFEVVDEDLLAGSQVLVARRVRPGPGGEPLPANCGEPPDSPGTVEAVLAPYLDAAGAFERDR